MRARCNEIKSWRPASIDAMELLEEQKQSLKPTLAVMRCIDTQISALERSVLAKVKMRADYKALKTVSGLGNALARGVARGPTVLGKTLQRQAKLSARSMLPPW